MDDILTILRSVSELGAAGAVILVVKLMLSWATKQAQTERDEHSKEIDKVISANQSGIDRMVTQHRESTSDITGELRAMRNEITGRRVSNV